MATLEELLAEKERRTQGVQTPGTGLQSLLAERERRQSSGTIEPPSFSSKIYSTPVVGKLASAAMNFPGSFKKQVSEFGETLGTLSTREGRKEMKEGFKTLAVAAYHKVTPGVQPDEKVIDEIGDKIHDLYGNYENASNTFAKDPARFMADLSSVLMVAGVGLKGVGASKLAKNVMRASDITDPITGAMMGTGKLLEQSKRLKTPALNISPFGKFVDKDVVKSAEKLGLDLPAAATTKSQSVQRIQSLFGSSEFRLKSIQARQTINKHFEKLISKIPPRDLEKIGNNVKDAFDKFQTSFRKQADKLYEEGLDPKLMNVTTDAKDTIGTHQSILAKGKKSFANRKGRKEFENILEGLTTPKVKEGKVLDQFGKTSKEIIPPKITYERLLETRKDIGKMLKNRTDPISTGFHSELEKIYGALSRDMAKTVEGFNPELGAKLAKANEYYKSEISKINSIVGKSIERSDPTRILDVFVKKNQPENLRVLQQMVDPETFEVFQATFVTDTLLKSVKETADGSQMISSKMIRQKLKGLGNEINEILLPPSLRSKLDDVIADIEDIETVMRGVKQGEKVALGSQTAFLNKITATVGGGSIAVFANPKLFVSAVIPAIFAERIISRLINTRAGQKLLGKGLKIPSMGPKGALGRGIQRAAVPVGRTGRAANIVEGVTGAPDASYR